MARKSRADVRRAVHQRIRKKVRGTTERPRLAVFRSSNHIYAQVIDDENGATVASASSVEKSLKVKSGGNVDGAASVGKAIAERAISAGVEQVVFDRGGFIYHGRVKALLDATREAGLNKNEVAKEKSKDEKPAKKGSSKKAEKKSEKKASKSKENKGKKAEEKKPAPEKAAKKEEKKDDSEAKPDKKPREKKPAKKKGEKKEVDKAEKEESKDE